MNQIETVLLVFLLSLLSMGCGKGFKANVASSGGIELSSSSAAVDQAVAVGGLGVRDPNCSGNPNYDTCLFWKNPVAQRGSAFASVLSFGQDLSNEQVYGVKLVNQLNLSKLESKSIRVGITTGQVAAPAGGKWKFAYQNDSGKGFIAQLMAYTWLTYQEQEMEKRTGVFYAKDRSIYVDAYDASITNNAYWDGTQISLGKASFPAGSHEMAMSAEVYLHEMGHANFQFAAATNLFNDSFRTGNSCTTAQGCITGINEGQADFHFLMIFGTATALGETWLNTPKGLESRDVKKITSLSVTDFYNLSTTKGEVHAMGSAYASILYAIYTSPSVNKADFEKIFSSHLTKMTGRSRFPEARDILIAEDAALFGGKYSAVIRAAFDSRGVQ